MLSYEMEKSIDYSGTTCPNLLIWRLGLEFSKCFLATVSKMQLPLPAVTLLRAGKPFLQEDFWGKISNLELW